VLSSRAVAILASAYELDERLVEEDARIVLNWTRTDDDLLTWLQERHGWSVASQYAPYYLADLRQRALSSPDVTGMTR
jgi:hypothetical protein